ncbi:MAG: hypothetical protein RIQ41_39 [Candidatus Parcubacteria bacterium]|jgi:hypothetical protein
MKRDLELCYPQEVQQNVGYLLQLDRGRYMVRLTGGTVIYEATDWSVTQEQDHVVVVLHDAHVMDSQGRRFVTEMTRVSRTPHIPIYMGKKMSVLWSGGGYYVPLPRACSLLFLLCA